MFAWRCFFLGGGLRVAGFGRDGAGAELVASFTLFTRMGAESNRIAHKRVFLTTIN